MLIDATHAEETRVVVVDGSRVDEFDFESLNKRQLAGNIYLAKVTRVEPSLQAAFVDYGGNRHGFLAFSEIHPDYYQIPKADREALIAEEAALAREADEEVAREKPKPRSRSRGRRRPQAAAEGTAADADAVVAEAPAEAAVGEGLDDLPPPSAAAGDIDIVVQEEPEAAEDEADAEAEPEGYEAVGGDDAAEERAVARRPRARRYKIQEVVKVRQIMLVQVVKEERGNKGAALTTYLSPRRALLRADAEHGARWRDQPQDHQRDRPQEAEGDFLLDHRAGRRGADHPHRGGEPDQDRDQARLRVPAAAVGADPRPDAEVDRARADLRGRQPDQAGDPRPLQPRHGRDPGRRRARATARPRTT